MKKLKIYKENEEFVIERVNEFNHATKRFFISEEGLKEELWSFVINFVNSKEFQG